MAKKNSTTTSNASKKSQRRYYKRSSKVQPKQTQTNTNTKSTQDVDSNAKSLAQLFGTLKNFVAEDPLLTAGYGISGAMNLGGLFDNSEFMGQLIGAGLGTGASFLPEILGQQNVLDPKYKVMAGMAGGALGSLFDNLQAKRKEEEARRQQYANNYSYGGY